MKITVREQLNESMPNIDKVVNFKDDSVEVHSDMDIVMTDAYDESIKNLDTVAEIMSELEDRADGITPENPEAPMEVKTKYTSQLKLDESLEDFNLQEAAKGVAARDENDGDKYLDYDMFEFVYELLAAGAKGITNLAPKTPIVYRKKVTYRKNKDGERVPSKIEWGNFEMKKFSPIGSDDASYGDTNEGAGVPQIAVEDVNIVVYSNDADDLKQASDGLAQYGIKTGEVRFKMNSNSHWDYSMTAYVPCYSDGEPMLMVDYLEDNDLSIDDVFDDKVAKSFKNAFKRADKKASQVDAKIKADKEARIYDEYVKKAFLDGTLDLEDVYAEMCAEMNAEGIDCPASLHSKFMAEFDEVAEDEE